MKQLNSSALRKSKHYKMNFQSEFMNNKQVQESEPAKGILLLHL